MKYIIFAALFQTLVSLFLLLSNPKKEKSDHLLVALLACIGWHLLTKFYIFTELGNQSVSTMMHTFIQLSYGPLIYLYAKKQHSKSFLAGARWYLFIPLIMSVALYCCVIATYFFYPDHGKIMLNIYNMMVFPPVVGSHFIFGILIIITNRNKGMAQYPLIRNLCLLLICVGAAEVMLTLIAGGAQQYTLFNRSMIYILLGIAPVLVIRHKFLNATGNWQQNLKQQFATYQAPQFALQLPGATDVQVDCISRKLLLDPGQHKEVFRKIESLIKNEQLYKEEDISLEKLATISGISRNYISETLNVFAKKSFYQYVNEYRIEEVIRTLNDNGVNESLLTIAYQAGFKNKSSFNTYFKKITGLTPSEYVRGKETRFAKT